jgi:hypothetical protein
MDKSARLAHIRRTALVKKWQSKQRKKCRWNESFSLIEVVAFADVATEWMGIDRHPRGNSRLPRLSNLPFPLIEKKRDDHEKQDQTKNNLSLGNIHN